MIFQSFNFQTILSFDDLKGVGNWNGKEISKISKYYYLRFNFLMRGCIVIFVSISILERKKK